MRLVFLTTIFLSTLSIIAQAQLKVTSLLSDNAVIQQGQPIKIWGKDTPGNEVVCSMAGVEASSFVSKEGTWFVELENAMQFHQEYILEVASESGKQQFNGLVRGDVWLASGQSNMFRFVNTTVVDSTGNLEYLDTLQNDSFENLRMFSISPKLSKNEERFIDAPTNSWHKWFKMTSLDFIRYQSATAYYTGRRLHKELDYPIGIIVAAMGGTPIELWSPTEAAGSSISNNVPKTTHFNGMISPIIPLSISGVIWYQGENNSGQPELYAEKFSAIFNAWQNRWSGDFPVFATLLAGYQANSFKNLRREQLLAARKNDNFYIASAFDIGNYSDIHPHQKKEVGERLASSILNNHYSEAYHPYLYPTIEGSFIRNDSFLIKVKNSKNLKAQNEPIAADLFQTYNENVVKIGNEASFLSDSIIHLDTFGQVLGYFEYNYVGYADNHIKLDGLPMHPYSSQSDDSFAYSYEYSPTQYSVEDSSACYSSSLDALPILLIDTLNMSKKIRFINVALADDCIALQSDYGSSHLLIYPNPSDGSINFQEEVKQVIIYSPSGQVILERNNVQSIDFKTFHEKIVFMKIELKTGEILVKKIVLQ
ncbi:MAG: sialate O-acetylesterase [Cyclobacteriaceae bacterium]